MNAIKNWLLPILLVVAGILDLGMGILNDFAAELSIPSNVVAWIRIIAIIVGAVILKLQAPTTNPEKLQELAARLAKKKEPEHY